MRNAFVFQERERCDLNLKSQLDTSMMVFDLRDVADSGQVGIWFTPLYICSILGMWFPVCRLTGLLDVFFSR